MNKLLVVTLFFIGVSHAQEFEVASIARTMPASMHNVGDAPGQPIILEPSILRMRAVTLADAIRWAYDLKPYELVGKDGKLWSESVGMPKLYYIEGHFDPSTSRSDVKVMLQSLLKERMGLLTHFEKKEMAVNQVKPSTKGLSKSVSLADESLPETVDRVVLQLSSPDGQQQLQVNVQNATMGQIVNELSRMARTPLMDATSFGDSRYTIKKWIIDFSDVKSATELQDAILGSLSQLGLTVSTGKSLVQVCIVDKINDKPTEN
jgi:uncharacterized protein (TIGR03435 family)